MNGNPSSRLLKPFLCVLVGGALTLAACGDSGNNDETAPPESNDGGQTSAEEYYKSLEGLTGEERQTKLLEDAKAAGTLSVYSGDNLGEVTAEAFEELYGIDVDIYQANSETMTQRLLSERDAGKVNVDIIKSDAPGMQIASEAGLLSPYTSEFTELLPPQAVNDDWVAPAQYTFCVARNTSAVQADELPEDLAGFAEPEWQGKVALELSDADWYGALYEYYLDQGMTEAEIDGLFGRLAANSETGNGHTAMVELLSAGQYPVLITAYNHNVELAESTGAPVTCGDPDSDRRFTVEPLVIKYSGYGLAKNANNPAGALLWADFELNEGQQVNEDNYRIGTVVTEDEADPLEGLDAAYITSEILADLTTWTNRYRELIGS